MGMIRSGLLVTASVFLFVGFLLMNSLLVVSNSLEYENVQNEIAPVVTEVIEGVDFSEVIDENNKVIEDYCKNHSEFVFEADEQEISVSCDSIEQGRDAIVNEAISEFVEYIYYDDYECGFIDCFGKSKRPYFLISEHAKNYFENKFYLVLLICLGISFAVFFLVENKSNAPILVGGFLIVSALPFIKLDKVVSFFSENSFFQLFTFLFAQSYFVAVKTIIFGVLLIAFGIMIKFFKIGFWISNLISKFRRTKKEKGSANVSKPSVLGKKVDISKKSIKKNKNIPRKIKKNDSILNKNI